MTFSVVASLVQLMWERGIRLEERGNHRNADDRHDHHNLIHFSPTSNSRTRNCLLHFSLKQNFIDEMKLQKVMSIHRIKKSCLLHCSKFQSSKRENMSLREGERR